MDKLLENGKHVCDISNLNFEGGQSQYKSISTLGSNSPIGDDPINISPQKVSFMCSWPVDSSLKYQIVDDNNKQYNLEILANNFSNMQFYIKAYCHEVLNNPLQ